MIVITSPTGHIGSQLLEILLENSTRGEELRVIVRDPAKLPEAVRSRVDIVTGSHGDADVVDRAFAGADAVFWLVPPDHSAPSQDTPFSGFTAAAAKALTKHRVAHVVGVSALGRGTPVADRAGHVTASLAMDDLIASTGVAYRALTNPTFMDNLLRQAISIRDNGVFTGTVAPDRAAPMVATRDIAAAAARLLIDRSWSGVGEVPVLGPEDLSPNDLARTMSEVLGRPISYRWESLDDFRATLTARGTSEAMATAFVDMMRAKENGLDDGVVRTEATRSPTTFREWCEQILAPAVGA
ncbi:NAD(P)H-binding protein [Nocardia sp. JMUB6875]|uniref:NAD(P)H-binding protein n=1 Tax=Nocardia sp. JMUB6875 TaxID=3158170 RepID=UPI0032E5D79B